MYDDDDDEHRFAINRGDVSPEKSTIHTLVDNHFCTKLAGNSLHKANLNLLRMVQAQPAFDWDRVCASLQNSVFPVFQDRISISKCQCSVTRHSRGRSTNRMSRVRHLEYLQMRAIACSSTAGFQSESKSTSLLAPTRFSPVPPARVDSRNT